MFPVKEEKLDEILNDKPLIFINTQTFHIRMNVKGMETLLNTDRKEMYTILYVLLPFFLSYYTFIVNYKL